MSHDTQWPRYHVFTQAHQGSPFQDAGSVHAPDAEMALLNARDVFARRPECFAMWVIPVEVIFAMTAHELERGQLTNQEAIIESPAPGELYQVFGKIKANGTLTWICSQDATSPSQALKLALARLPAVRSAFTWWALPDREITRSQATDYESLYQPAETKTFRLSTDFHTISAMRKIKAVQETNPTSGPPVSQATQS